MVAARRASRPALMVLEPARPSWSGVSAEGVDVHVEEGTCCCCACRRAARAARRRRCERAVRVRRRGRRVGQASTGRQWRCSGRRTARRAERPRGTRDALGPVRVRYVDGTSRRRAGGAARSVRRVCAWVAGTRVPRVRSAGAERVRGARAGSGRWRVASCSAAFGAWQLGKGGGREMEKEK